MFEFKDVFIGRTPDRSRVFVDVTWDDTRLSFTGEVIESGRHGAVTTGQIADIVREVNPGLADLWERWHLNDMRPGCEHHEHVMRLNPRTRPTGQNDYTGSTGLTLGSTCYVCGSKYGEQWHHETVPEAVLGRVRAIMSTTV